MTDVYASAERPMGMTGPVWLRHATPWSGWTRLAIAPPLLIAAARSRVRIGWWAAVPVSLVLGWIWVNPRAFAPPEGYGGWMSRAGLGERIWLARGRFDRPAHHARIANLAAVLAAAGAGAMIWGVAVLDPWAAGLGALLAVTGKAWFCDRMIRLHAEITGIPPGGPMPRPIPFDTHTGDMT